MNEVSPENIRVLVTDDKGNTFHLDWKKSAKRGDAIRWTIESEDLFYYLTGEIVKVEIITKEETK